MSINRFKVLCFSILLLGLTCIGICDDSPYLDYGHLKPRPQRIIYENNSKVFALNKDANYELIVTENLLGDARFFAQRIKDFTITEKDIKVARDKNLSSRSKYAILLRIDENWNGPENFPMNCNKPQGYSMMVAPEGFCVIASDSAGAFYGLQTILQMLVFAKEKQKNLPAVLISDWPDVLNRAVMLNLKGLRRDSDITYLKRLLAMFASLKYNNVFFEFSFALPGPKYAFPRLTGAGKQSLDDKTIAQLCDYARKLHIDVNLAFQFGGHCTWLLYEPKYKDLGETTPDKFAWQNTNWSPANPKLWKIIEDLMRHQIKVCKPKRIHIAHDEMAYGEFNTSPSSKKANLTNEQLISLGINKLRKIIPADIETIVWIDLFMPNDLKLTTNRKFVDSDKMIKLTPKELVMNIWYYDGSYKHIPAAEYFKKNNRKYWTSTFKARDVARVCYYTNMLGAEGVVGTYWYEADCSWNNPKNISSLAMQAIIELACFSWNPSTIDDFIEQDFAREFKILVEGPDCADNETENISVDLSGVTNFPSDKLESQFSILDELIEKIDSGKGKHLVSPKLAPKGKGILLAGKSSEKNILPQKVMIPINREVSAVSFYHTANTAVPEAGMNSWQRSTAHDKLGTYKLIFGDSKGPASQEIPLEYRWNIQDWNNHYGSYNSQLAWLYTATNGHRMQVQKYTWEYDKKGVRFLKAIEFTSDMTSGMNPLLLQITTHKPSAKSKLSGKKDDFVVWSDDFEYETIRDLREKWKGAHQGSRFDIPTLKTEKAKSGRKSLMWNLVPTKKNKLRQNIGFQAKNINISEANKIIFSMRIPQTNFDVKSMLCAIYLGNSTQKYWYVFTFTPSSDGKWKTYELPLSGAATEGVLPKEGGLSDLDTMIFSIWHTNKKSVTVLIDDIKIVKSSSNSLLYNTAR